MILPMIACLLPTTEKWALQAHQEGRASLFTFGTHRRHVLSIPPEIPGNGMVDSKELWD
jgi:hypothetical protein